MKQLKTGVLVWWLWLVAGSLSSAGAPRIVFDYSYDSNGFFTPDRRVLLERAAAEFTSRMTTTTWAQVDPTTAGGHYELAVVNPSTMSVTWITNAIIPTNQITVHVGATDFTKSPFYMMTNSMGDGASQLMFIRNISGAMTNLLANPTLFRPTDAGITFDLQGVRGFGGNVSAQWYFSTNANLTIDDQPPAPPYCYYSDFYTTAVHELGHVLGIWNPLPFQALMATDPKYCLAWTSKIQSNAPGSYVFTGAHAKQCYYNHIGTNIPLDPDSLSHWADGVRSTPSNNWTSVTHEYPQPFRTPFSELEFGALQDLGYVITPVPKASITSLTVSNSMLTGRLGGLIPYLQCYLALNGDLAVTNGWTNMQAMLPTGTVATVSGPIPSNTSRLFFRLHR
jgi:hypothetical protein